MHENFEQPIIKPRLEKAVGGVALLCLCAEPGKYKQHDIIKCNSTEQIKNATEQHGIQGKLCVATQWTKVEGIFTPYLDTSRIGYCNGIGSCQ